jgi:hypothetical protein
MCPDVVILEDYAGHAGRGDSQFHALASSAPYEARQLHPPISVPQGGGVGHADEASLGVRWERPRSRPRQQQQHPSSAPAGFFARVAAAAGGALAGASEAAVMMSARGRVVESPCLGSCTHGDSVASEAAVMMSASAAAGGGAPGRASGVRHLLPAAAAAAVFTK